MFVLPALALLVSFAQSPRAQHTQTLFLAPPSQNAVGGLGYTAQPAPGQPPRVVVQQSGVPRHGWLGVSLENVDGGVRIASVVPDSPAQRAQLRAGDRITAIAGSKVDDYDGLIKVLRAHDVGDTVELSLQRDLQVELSDERKDGDRYMLGVFLGEPVKSRSDKSDKAEAKDKSAGGIAVTRVSPGYPAARAGIAGGDVVLSVEGKPVDSSEAVISALGDVHEQRAVSVRIVRQRKVELGTTPQSIATNGQQVEPGPTPRGWYAPSQPRTNQPPTLMPREDVAPEGLEDELRALSQELRELREQVARLRSEIDRLRTR